MYNFGEMESISKLVIIVMGGFILYQIIGLLSNKVVLNMKGGDKPSGSKQQTIVYLFYTTSCHHCTTIRGDKASNGSPNPKTAWGKIYNKYTKSPDIKVVEINAEDDPSKTILYNIEAYPTIVLVKPDGSHVEFTGDNTAEEIDKFIERERGGSTTPP